MKNTPYYSLSILGILYCLEVLQIKIKLYNIIL